MFTCLWLQLYEYVRDEDVLVRCKEVRQMEEFITGCQQYALIRHHMSRSTDSALWPISCLSLIWCTLSTACILRINFNSTCGHQTILLSRASRCGWWICRRERPRAGSLLCSSSLREGISEKYDTRMSFFPGPFLFVCALVNPEKRIGCFHRSQVAYSLRNKLGLSA